MARKCPAKIEAPDPPLPPVAVPMPAPSDHPGACCPGCSCRHCPVQFTQRSGKRTIRTRRCRNCTMTFREIAVSVRLR